MDLMENSANLVPSVQRGSCWSCSRMVSFQKLYKKIHKNHKSNYFLITQLNNLTTYLHPPISARWNISLQYSIHSERKPIKNKGENQYNVAVFFCSYLKSLQILKLFFSSFYLVCIVFCPYLKRKNALKIS